MPALPQVVLLDHHLHGVYLRACRPAARAGGAAIRRAGGTCGQAREGRGPVGVPRALARATRGAVNAGALGLAGRLAVADLEHAGRKSGTVRHTPVRAFRSGNTVIVGLNFGRQPDWYQNIKAAGTCRMRLRGEQLTLGAPALVPAAQGLTDLPWLVRKLPDDYVQTAQTCRDCASGIADACGPGSPDSHRVVWGLTSRPPVPPAGFPPVSRLPAGFSPVARLPPVSRRPAFSGSSPSAVAQVPVPLSVSLRVPFPWAILTIALPPGGSAGVGPGRQGPRSPALPPPSRSWISPSSARHPTSCCSARCCRTGRPEST